MGIQYRNNPEDNFEAFWLEFDQMYGLFRVKGVDWGAVYGQYRPMVDGQTTDEELYAVFVEMLSLLDDGHIILLPVGTDLPMYRGGPAGKIDTTRDFNLELPNGWGYSMSIGEWRAADGRSYEGIGLPPDEVVQNVRADYLNGRDEALERAIELLR
ncbi:MAG: hypothetical protein RIC19_14235 [Phaeodactylibacter sp.]|uniref:hypothetical protein n=1 Tax=Phaeodactylibacter sp. TaxID=1940289 RepID=UPI0032EF6D86